MDIEDIKNIAVIGAGNRGIEQSAWSRAQSSWGIVQSAWSMGQSAWRMEQSAWAKFPVD